MHKMHGEQKIKYYISVWKDSAVIRFNSLQANSTNPNIKLQNTFPLTGGKKNYNKLIIHYKWGEKGMRSIT
jgi:hypothetical protein